MGLALCIMLGQGQRTWLSYDYALIGGPELGGRQGTQNKNGDSGFACISNTGQLGEHERDGERTWLNLRSMFLLYLIAAPWTYSRVGRRQGTQPANPPTNSKKSNPGKSMYAQYRLQVPSDLPIYHPINLPILPA